MFFSDGWPWLRRRASPVIPGPAPRACPQRRVHRRHAGVANHGGADVCTVASSTLHRPRHAVADVPRSRLADSARSAELWGSRWLSETVRSPRPSLAGPRPLAASRPATPTTRRRTSSACWRPAGRRPTTSRVSLLELLELVEHAEREKAGASGARSSRRGPSVAGAAAGRDAVEGRLQPEARQSGVHRSSARLDQVDARAPVPRRRLRAVGGVGGTRARVLFNVCRLLGSTARR